MLRATCIALALAAAGCAGRSPEGAGWNAEEVAGAPAERVVLRHGGTHYRPLRAETIRALIGHKEAVERAAGELRTRLVIVADATPNGMLFFEDGAAVIGVSVGMLELLGDDRDAFAALVGHELAHLYQRHAEARSRRQHEQDQTSGLIGFALAVIGVPLGATLADAATAVAERSYSRDEELEADRLGLDYLNRAGFDPYGAVRLHERLASLPERSALRFLSTHPPAPDRVEALRRIADTLVPATAPREPR